MPRLLVDANVVVPGGARGAVSPIAAQRMAAIVVVGVGIVGLGVGGIFGLSAQSSYSESKDLCSDSNVCTSHGSDLRSSARSKALVSAQPAWALPGWRPLLCCGSPRPRRRDPSARPSHVTAMSVGWAIAPNYDGWGLEVTRAF